MDIERIATYHDKESFTCGEAEVDDFLRFKALDEDYGQTWVIVPQAGSGQIIGYYTIDPDPIVGIQDDEYNEYPIGLVILQMLGVDASYQRQGFGKLLLGHAIKRILITARRHSINGLFLTALNQNAKNWYLHCMDFKETEPGSMNMILPVTTMRQLPDYLSLGTIGDIAANDVTHRPTEE